jgi:hypothetical protein
MRNWGEEKAALGQLRILKLLSRDNGKSSGIPEQLGQLRRGASPARTAPIEEKLREPTGIEEHRRNYWTHVAEEVLVSTSYLRRGSVTRRLEMSIEKTSIISRTVIGFL